MTKRRNLAPLILLVTVVVAVLAGVAVQAQYPDDRSYKPQVVTTMLVIVGGIGVMLAYQRAWFERARRDANPTSAADRTIWRIAGQSMADGRVVVALVAAFQPAAIILERPAIGALGAIPVVLFALTRVARLLRPGGTLDEAYAATDDKLEPLGLRVVARPRIEVRPRLAGGGLQKEVVGPTVIAGERSGRPVRVTIEGRRALIELGAERVSSTPAGWQRDLERAEAAR